MNSTFKEAHSEHDQEPDRHDQPGGLPATDQDRSIAFYEALGFEKRTDIPFGDKYRWVEVTHPAAHRDRPGAAPAGQRSAGRRDGNHPDTDDIDATHAQLQSDGVDVDTEVARMGDPVPPMFWFRDPAATR